MNKKDDCPVYTIFAGVNGAGKTSLYSVLKNMTELGERVNIDEIAFKLGNWRDTLIQIKAGREAMNRINRYISLGVSFHQETTLPGPTVIRHIKKAKAVGFRVRLNYIGLDNIETAIGRVHRRIEKGGHGIDDSIIIRRFENLPRRLRVIMPLCDRVVFYDNTVRFRQIAIMQGSRLLDCDRDLPDWFGSLFGDDGNADSDK
jgi:predicted ABC-type ATPase